MNLRNLAVLFVLMALLVAGCSNQNPVETQMYLPLSASSALTLPEGAQIESVTFNIYVERITNHTIDVHRVTSMWDELAVTWNNFGAAYDPAIVASFVADAKGWKTADITSLFTAWMDGTYDNFGLLLDQEIVNYPRTTYTAREAATNTAFIEVCYSTSEGVACVQSMTIADTYIWEQEPNNNYGNKVLLYTGWENENQLEKQALLLFEVPEEPQDEGCTRTPGYWKNWSGLGPQPDMITQYLPVWLGDEGGATSIQVTTNVQAVDLFNMKSFGGASNGIAKLYRHLLAAKLNIAAGATGDDVDDAIAEADEFLANHAWTDWAGLDESTKQMILGWGNTIDQYNNGVIGPGHCESDFDNDGDNHDGEHAQKKAHHRDNHRGGRGHRGC